MGIAPVPCLHSPLENTGDGGVRLWGDAASQRDMGAAGNVTYPVPWGQARVVFARLSMGSQHPDVPRLHGEHVGGRGAAVRGT